MKWRTCFLVLMAGFAVACNTQHSHDAKPEDGAAATVQAATAAPSSDLELNNGNKWKADALTMLHARALQQIIDSALAQSPANHAATTARLEAELSKMVSDCKMKGPDHDALHLWLEPFMDMVKTYKQDSVEASQGTQLQALQQQARLFNMYFEE